MERAIKATLVCEMAKLVVSHMIMARVCKK
jgi:hypothetical protein